MGGAGRERSTWSQNGHKENARNENVYWEEINFLGNLVQRYKKVKDP